MSRHATRIDAERTGVWWWTRTVLSWSLLLAMTGILLLTIVVPRAGGAEPYTVLTGSMEPTYPPGTLIVVKPQDPASLRVGDAITFQWESGKPAVVTHRIIAVEHAADGGPRFTTQGDANSSPDERTVIPEQIRGKVWYAVPFVGYANNYITGEQRSVLLLVVVGGLVLYALYMFTSSARDSVRRRRQRSTSQDAAATDVLPVLDAPAPAGHT